MGAIQSGEFPIQFSPNGKYVEMGDFKKISNNHDKNNIIRLYYTVPSIETFYFDSYWKIDKDNNLPFLNSLIVSSSYFKLLIKKNTNYSLKFEYYLDNDPLKIKRVIELTFKDINDLDKLIKERDDFDFKRIFSTITSVFSVFDKGTNYISSLRLQPDRTYYEQAKTDLKVNRFGERYTDQIIFWQTKEPKKYQELITKLKDINLLSDIKAKRMQGGRYELVIKPSESGVECSLADVGYGISQFLPIVVADLQLDNDSMLFVSQPEIHLHPSIQANFADYLINQIKTTNKSYVIETHSEYLINRIRLAIAKGEVENNDIKSYFFHNNGNDVENYELEFTKSGQIKYAPDDFFNTYMIEVMDIAINSVE